MNISDIIEQLIIDMLENSDNNSVDLQRNDMATKLGCVPSQINYVITRRFTTEHGYTVESRRGGGGYIRISRAAPDVGGYIMHLVNCVGDAITYREAESFLQNCLGYGVIQPSQAAIMLAAISDNTLRIDNPPRNNLRARIFKNMLLAVSGQ